MTTKNSKTKKTITKRQVKVLTLAILGMFAFCYALVPLYNVFCKVTGLNGKTGGKIEYVQTADKVDEEREITLEFVATRNESMPWRFHPNIAKIKVHPGEQKRITYFAANPTDHQMTIQAIPSVSPGIAAKYLKKTECFCFTNQTFKAGEKMDMPVVFHIDKDLPKNINTITLSYTLFDLTDKVKKKT